MRKKAYIEILIYRFYNLKRENDLRVISLGKRTIIFWAVAVTSWICDKFLCNYLLSLGYPYLHGIWHVMVFFASYTSVVLFAFFDAKNVHIEVIPKIRYWPKDTFELGIPFVFVKKRRRHFA